VRKYLDLYHWIKKPLAFYFEKEERGKHLLASFEPQFRFSRIWTLYSLEGCI